VRSDSLVILTSLARQRGEIAGTLVLSGERGGVVKRRDVLGVRGEVVYVLVPLVNRARTAQKRSIGRHDTF